MADVAHTGIGIERRAVSSSAGGTVGDFVALMKPRVMSLVVFTAFVGLVLAPTPMHPVMAFTAKIKAAMHRAGYW